ncbi:MAG: helix-turn-helix transcriptional regulator [Burkholderiales bacterium]|nr:helix-turn-helix transcriptional regulator [Burkholderiales bacterium]
MFRIRIDYRFSPARDGAAGAHLGNPLFALLAAIRASGSISRAAADLGYSYRHVWGELKRWEAELAHPLIVWEKGRRARLTPFGEKLLWAEERARARIAPQVQGLASELESAFAVAFDDNAHVLSAQASHDLALPLLKDLLLAAGVHLDLQYRGSLDALAALSAGRCLLAGFHVSDDHGPRSATARAFKRHLVPGRHKLIDFAARRQGLMTAPGNPLAIGAVADLARPGVRFVNRQRGSGTRVEIDQLIAGAGLDPARIDGFADEEATHLAVAAAVAAGAADVGFGIEAAALRYGLAFVPLVAEHYYLACLKQTLDTPAMQRLLAVMQGAAWRAQAAALPGYTLVAPGAVLSLTRALPWYRYRAPRPAS